MRHPVHAFLRGEGPDARGRRLAEVIALDDAGIEATHDVVQWLFPLAEPSRAVPGSPTLDGTAAAAIRDDPDALRGFRAGLDRMTRFYASTDAWLVRHDHNHLRISRIIAATRRLLGPDAARGFHAGVTSRDAAAGHRVDPGNRRHWDRALSG